MRNEESQRQMYILKVLHRTGITVLDCTLGFTDHSFLYNVHPPHIPCIVYNSLKREIFSLFSVYIFPE